MLRFPCLGLGFPCLGLGEIRARNLTCNRPVKSWRPGKKKAVLACEGGRRRVVHYGAQGYRHNYSPGAKRSFRARHGCDRAERGSKLTARYWACRDLWPRSRKGW